MVIWEGTCIHWPPVQPEPHSEERGWGEKHMQGRDHTGYQYGNWGLKDWKCAKNQCWWRQVTVRSREDEAGAQKETNQPLNRRGTWQGQGHKAWKWQTPAQSAVWKQDRKWESMRSLSKRAAVAENTDIQVSTRYSSDWGMQKVSGYTAGYLDGPAESKRR